MAPYYGGNYLAFLPILGEIASLSCVFFGRYFPAEMEDALEGHAVDAVTVAVKGDDEGAISSAPLSASVEDAATAIMQQSGSFDFVFLLPCFEIGQRSAEVGVSKGESSACHQWSVDQHAVPIAWSDLQVAIIVHILYLGRQQHYDRSTCKVVHRARLQ